MNIRNRKHADEPHHDLVWFRITVVVMSAGFCTAKMLIWLGL